MASLELEKKLKEVQRLIEEGKTEEAIETTEKTLKQIFSLVFREAKEELSAEKRSEVEEYQNSLKKPVDKYSIYEFLKLFTIGNILEAYQERKQIKLKYLNGEICNKLLNQASKEGKGQKNVMNQDPSIAYSMLSNIARDFNLLSMDSTTKTFYDLVEDLTQENIQEFTSIFSFDENWENIGLNARVPRNTGLYVGTCPYCDKSIRMIYNKLCSGHNYYPIECPHCSQEIGCHNKFAGVTSELSLDKYDPSRSDSSEDNGYNAEDKKKLLRKLEELDKLEKKMKKK